MTLTDLQKELSPRISAQDFTDLLRNSPEKLLVLDIRTVSEYNQVRLPHSLNLPFNLLQTTNGGSLDSLNLDPVTKETLLQGSRINVCVSNHHESAVTVSTVL